jgi:conjugal transfer mating pair stabilization protein TraN
MMKNLITLIFLGLFHVLAIAQTCTLIPGSKKCVDATPCKQIAGEWVCLANSQLVSGGISIPQTCWQFSYDFACAGKTIDSCAPYASNAACSIVSSKCADTTPETGQCNTYQNAYSCKTKEEVREQRLSCSSGVFDDSMMPTPKNENSTFVKAALAQEILRQSATYGKNGENIFAGVVETCSKGYFGIKNCCKPAPGATSNSAMASLAMSAGYSAAKYVGGVAVDMASPYVFDAMFAGGEYLAGLAWNFASSSSSAVVNFASNSPVGTGFAAGGPSLSAYGFTFQSGIAAQGSGLLGANTTLATFGSGSSTYSVTFNPYVFAAMVAIQVIQNLASCSDAERLLAMHKGANLSVFIKEECSQRILGSCVKWQQTYCSFNSVLSRLINTQGKPQLGLPVSDCKGMSVEQISKLDFTRIDLSEFAGAMVQQATKNAPTNIQGNYTPVMQNAPGGSIQGTNANIPSYTK